MNRKVYLIILYSLIALAVPPALFLCNLARYLAPDALAAYAIILFVSAVFLSWTGSRAPGLARAFANSPAVAALHAVAAFAVCYYLGGMTSLMAGAVTCAAVFFSWLALKLCVTSPAMKDRAVFVLFWGGGAVCFIAAFHFLPFPLNYVPFVLMFFAYIVRGTLNRRWPDRKAAGRALASVYFFVIMILAIQFTTCRHGVSAQFIALLILPLEALYILRVHRLLKNVFFPVVVFADLALLAAVAAPGASAYLSPLSGVMIVFYQAIVAAAVAVLKLSDEKRARLAGSSVAFLLCVAVFVIAFSQIRPCDHKAVSKDFIIHSSEESSYDMVLSRDGRHLYAVFGSPRNTVEKIDISGGGKNIVYKLHDRKAQPERLFIDEKRNRIVVAIWGSHDKKIGVFNADNLKPVGIYGGGALPKNPDNIKADKNFKNYYLLGERTGEVAKLDPDTMEPVNYGKSSIGIAYGMCMDDERKLLYTAAWIGPNMTAIKTGSMKNKMVFRTEIIKAEIACDTKTGRVFSGNFVKDYLSVYDISEGRKRVKKIPTAFGSRDLAIDPAGRTLISGAYFSGIIEGIDLDSGERLFSAEPGKYVRGVEYDPKAGRVFVACHCGILEMKKRFKRT